MTDWTDGDPLLTQCVAARAEINEVVDRLKRRVAYWTPRDCPPRFLKRVDE